MSDRRFKLLTIEDDPEDVKLLRKLLGEIKDYGFSLEVEYTLARGLERLKRGDIEVVIVDLSLPDGRGLNAIKECHSKFTGVPIIAANVVANDALAVQAISEGAQDYLVKGKVTAAQLQCSVVYAVERKKLELQLARMASFAWQNPNAIIEISREGEIVYANPVALKHFPDLASSRETKKHPFLEDLAEIVGRLQRENKDVVIRDITLQGKIYEQQISYVPETGATRFYITEMTEQKKADKELKARTEEIERMNRVMLGREMKMVELKARIAELEGMLGIRAGEKKAG